MKKTLVAYFSASGSTAQLAKTIAEVTGGDLFEIKPEQPYTSADLNWNDKKSRSSIEMSDPNSRPAIATTVKNMDEYDTVFVGFPIWWYVAPLLSTHSLKAMIFPARLSSRLPPPAEAVWERQTVCSKDAAPIKRSGSRAKR